ncbi:LysR family transcriptional regulator [Epilithonimonas ginsengisoli]|uniref:LysR family transcriptional regulator n=1 Tax=Epilithonimonas ginsengisoli TaxID=1245592 RepID=A0ABU4JGE8_9FLAO|nr:MULTISPECIES: LysR family transcriptional regulator [Chryseobacterium group]MBV6880088.1 LysR family transcriptional regulator [Epilithonimonas sp. FP105]MDW8548738.1 LysR family transcriptional regulator [Epilithonimonas ginsengisoli]OAH75012.1 LysR family transcriptional regulator [Chryseobacterium sp. FP211-J200]
MINLEWLRTFKSVYETRSFTKAAKELYISQPGVSLHIGSLEAYVGYTLFERISKKLIPTEKAKILYNFTLEPLLKLETAEQTFHKTTKTERSTVSIGMCFETFQFTLEKHIPTLDFNVIIRFGLYEQMFSDLDHGLLDLIITPHKTNLKNLEFEAFSKEKIVLVNGSETDTSELKTLLKNQKIEEAEDWLKQQIWYSTAADMEHLNNFWKANFNRHPDFKPNYIVPNICSIVRCLSGNSGFSIVPDFLCKKEIASGGIEITWEGNQKIENILHFGERLKNPVQKEVDLIKSIFRNENF